MWSFVSQLVNTVTYLQMSEVHICDYQLSLPNLLLKSFANSLTGLPNDLCVATRNDMKYPKFGEGCQMV